MALQEFLFDGMARESGRARSGNAGTRPETHTGDSALLPATQREQVRVIVLRGGWWTLDEIAAETGWPTQSISARLRDLRKARYGRYVVAKRLCGHSPVVWEYRVIS